MLRLVVDRFPSHEGQSEVWPSFFSPLTEVLCIPGLLSFTPTSSTGDECIPTLIPSISLFEEAEEHRGPRRPRRRVSTLLRSWNRSWCKWHRAGCARRGRTVVLKVLQPSTPSWSCKCSEGSGWEMGGDNQRLESPSPPCCFFLTGRDKQGFEETVFHFNKPNSVE